MIALKRAVLGLCLVVLTVIGWQIVSLALAGAAQPLVKPKDAILTRFTTADHSQFEQLQRPFKSGPEVTAACLSCHNEAGEQFHQTIHWTWRDKDPESDLGKAGLVINNFCIAMPSSETRCTSCHAGYGWRDKSFDFSKQENIDCLVCHEQTGTYRKFPAGAGNPAPKPIKFMGKKLFKPPDWNRVAQSVSRPTRKNCGTCHFLGGGGEGVKHGDLDISLMKPNRERDVHMNAAGANFDCTRCHTTEAHEVAGRFYKYPASRDRRSLVDDDTLTRITCESCHTLTPHKTDAKMNDHTDRVACQTCHIPTMARARSTKMRWDWSTAGKKKEGGGFLVKKKDGRPVYHTLKGSFVWAKDVQPEYMWFNGSMTNITARDQIDPGSVVRLAWPDGDMSDPDARIYPFKVHTGRQPYDKGNRTMVIPKLFGKKGSGAYWGGFDWNTAITRGMAYSGLPYSGEYDWVETAYAFPTTHMVAPREQALACAECHSDNGRLAGLDGFYMPGRDGSRTLNYIGWGAALASLIGVFFHGLARVVSRRRNGRG